MAMRKFIQQKIIPRSPSFSASYYLPYSFTQSHNSGHRRRLHHLICQSVPPSSFAIAQQFLAPFRGISSTRSFSTRDSASVAGCPPKGGDLTAAEPSMGSDILPGGYLGRSASVEEFFRSIQDIFFPIDGLISLLDACHDLTGYPWWVIIASGTFTMRLALFPFLILLLRKLGRIGEIISKLPSPFPRRPHRRSFRDQIKFFLREKRATGCPSFLWFPAGFLQAPFFTLWILTVRRMSLDHHDGFDCGGILWFQNLSDFPNGTSGSIFPLLVAGLYFANIKVLYMKLPIASMGELAKLFKLYSEVMTIPTMFIAFYIPQGSLVCWATNSSFSLVQQMALNNPYVCKKLGLPDKNALPLAAKQKPNSGVIEDLCLSTELCEIVAQNQSPSEMVKLSTEFLAKDEKDMALTLLRYVVDKNPEYIRAQVVSGQALLKYDYIVEAIEYSERAISKLLLNGHPTVVEDIDLLIQASETAGIAYTRQGKYEEGLEHLSTIAKMKEPEDPNLKASYYEALVVVASALYNAGYITAASKYLRKAVAYDDSYRKYLEEFEKGLSEEDEFIGSLVHSRRADY